MINDARMMSAHKDAAVRTDEARRAFLADACCRRFADKGSHDRRTCFDLLKSALTPREKPGCL
ncbi:MAG: hypothetical protein MI923_12125 [Phycisphaerales bacterium]|nr:hypothetical protein [Phycisphaerales bacterium]